MITNGDLFSPKIPSQSNPFSIPHLSFYTNLGKIVPSITSEQMFCIYELLQETGPNRYQILENTGRNLAKLAIKFLNGKENSKVVILVGAAGNGAGGLVAARHLANHKINTIVCKSRAYQLTDEVVYQRNIYQLTTGKEAQIGSLPVESVDLIIDALIGCGLRGIVTGPTQTLITWANSNGAPILSLDVPTGIDPNSGQSEGDYIHATATLALGLPKKGMIKERSGKLYVTDIGIPSSIYKKAGIDYVSPFTDKYTMELNVSS